MAEPTLILLAIAAIYLAGYWMQRASQQSDRQTEVLVAAIAALKAKPSGLGGKPADMPWAIWSEV